MITFRLLFYSLRPSRLILIFRLRDDALKNVAFASRDAYSLFYPLLLSKVACLDPQRLYSLYILLTNRPHLAKCIKSLHLLSSPQHCSASDIASMSTLLPEVLPGKAKTTISDLGHEMRRIILSRTTDLQTLISTEIGFYLSPIETVEGRRVHLSFSNSIKRLHIPFLLEQQEASDSMSGRNILWLLVFCPSLTEAVFFFSLSHEDYLFLEEYNEVFKGKSNVKKLSLMPTMSLYKSKYANKSWEAKQQGNGKWKGGNRASHSIFNILLVTKNLWSLDLREVRIRTEGGHKDVDNAEFDLYSYCLSGLFNSYDSLKHIRVGRFQSKVDIDSVADFSKFKALKILGLEGALINIFRRAGYAFVVPNVEIVHLVAYQYGEDSIQPDQTDSLGLPELLKSPTFPNLKQLVVPSSPINIQNQLPKSAQFLKAWKEERSALENDDLFKDGEIKLRVLKAGETGKFA